MSNNPEEAHQNTYQYIMRKIDMYGEPLQWYIGSNETYQTVAGGFRTFLVFSITFIYLVYLIIMLFKDRSGSFVMYDISYSELDDAEFKYYEHFEIFFYFKSSSAMMEMDTSIFRAYLTQIDSSESYTAQYPFEECDNEYFAEQLGFSANVKGGLEKTYCIDPDQYSNMTFSLAQISPLGETTNAVKFVLIQTCEGSSCTDDENSKFKEAINQIQDVKVFIKCYTPNPLKMKNVLQSQVISFTLTNNYKGATIYFKNYNITTQSSLIPYIVGDKKVHFLAYDYSESSSDTQTTTRRRLQDGNEGSGSGSDGSSDGDSESDSTYYLEFVLSSKYSFLDRQYEQLDSTFANLLGVFNALEVIGRALTFIFDSFSKEFFIFNFILKDRMFRKNKKRTFVGNPPKIVNPSNDDFINNSGSKDKELLKLDDNHKKREYSPSLSKNNFFSEENEMDKNLKNPESDDKILSENNKDNNGKEEEINIGILKSFWCNILMTFDKDKSKYPEIENALEKIKLVQEMFDTSIYINLIFDMMRLKKIIFNESELKLFESIHFTFEEIQVYLHKFFLCEDITPEKFINQEIERNQDKKNNKLTENIIQILKEQINI